ncbi:MAG: tetratricopeptide repeat protein [Holophagaceae bacterium]|nr:tetratricopeptide repeat protein [Holophagaceae bacterium]
MPPALPAFRTGLLAAALSLAAATAGGAQEDPRALMVQARSMQRRSGGDDPAGAVVLYRRVIQLVPRSAEAQLRLSEALAETGDLPGAIESGRKACELAPANAEMAANLGLLQYRRAQGDSGAYPEAKAGLLAATVLLPTDPELWARLAEIAEGLKDKDTALRAWLQVGRLRPSVTLAWERAYALAKEVGSYEGRREAVLAMCQGRTPEGRQLRLLEDLARDQIGAGYLAHAEESFQLLARHLPMEPAVWENIALVQVRTQRFEEALGNLATAEGLRATPRVRYNQALCFMNLGRYAEAEAKWRETLPDASNSSDSGNLADGARSLLGVCLFLQGKEQALLDQLAAWPETPENGDLLALRAQALLRLQRWKEARATLRDGMARFPRTGLFQQAKEIPPDLFDEGLFSRKPSRQALTLLEREAAASTLAEFKDWKGALAVLESAKALRAKPNVNLLLLESNVLDQMGRYDEAIQVLRRVQTLAPENPTLQNNLGYLLLERGGDLEEAARLIGASVDKDPQNGSVQDSWGWVLFKQGKFGEAEKSLRRASELSPYSPEVRKHLGEALLKLGRRGEAAEQWERALAFSFPGRKQLEKRLSELRAQLAREGGPAAAGEVPAKPDPADDGEGDGDGDEERLP